MAKTQRVTDMDVPTGGVALPHGLRRRLAPPLRLRERAHSSSTYSA